MVEISRSSHFSDELKKYMSELRKGSDLIDVTLVSGDGKQFAAHRIVLAASSPFFKSIFISFNRPHPILYMRGVSSFVLGGILEFLYKGIVTVPENEIGDFLSFAKEMNIKGLQEYAAEREDTIVYLPKSPVSPESESKMSDVVETKVEYVSEVDKKLLHIFLQRPATK